MNSYERSVGNATSTSLNFSLATSKNFDYYNPGTPLDIALDTLLVASVLLSLYILIVLLWYEWNLHNKADEIGPSRIQSKFGTGLRSLCIFSALLCLLRSINDIAYYKAQSVSHIPCTVLKNIGASWLFDVNATVYLFLWLRHQALYRSRSTRLPSNIFVKVMTWVTFILIISLLLAQNVVVLGWRTYEYNALTAKCVLIGKVAQAINQYLFLAGSQSLHVVLLLLFIYPLLKHRSAMRTKRRNADRLPKNASSISGEKKSLMGVVLKCTLLSFLCVATDGLIVLSTFTVKNSKARHFAYNINVIINTVAIILSFSEWRQMLIPFYNSCRCASHSVNKSDTNGNKVTEVGSKLLV